MATMLPAKLTTKLPAVWILAGEASSQLPPLLVAAETLMLGTPDEALTKMVRGEGSNCPVWTLKVLDCWLSRNSAPFVISSVTGILTEATPENAVNVPE